MSISVHISNVNIDISRKKELENEFNKPYFLKIKEFLLQEKNNLNTIYPEWKNIFNAFNKTPFDKVRVVILWQDPYHWQWEAHWLCFSVQDWIKQPPSLKNIFKEIQSDLWIFPPQSWNLTKRAEQWVLLINSILTVKKDSPASHKDIWRNLFTDEVIKKLSEKKSWLIFLLRWAFAQSKESLIDTSKHIILKTTHPSPFSVHKGFFWCKHFSQVNEILINKWEKEINWKLE